MGPFLALTNGTYNERDGYNYTYTYPRNMSDWETTTIQ